MPPCAELALDAVAVGEGGREPFPGVFHLGVGVFEEVGFKV